MATRVLTFSTVFPAYQIKKGSPEIWVPVRRFELSYAISSHGRVKSLKRTCKKWDGIRTVKEKILKPGIGSNGYLTVGFCVENVRRTFHVHKLVVIHFIIKKIPKNLQINHLDGNKRNCAAYNLEVTTPSKNRKHAFLIGLQERPSGELNAMARLSNRQIVQMRKMMSAGKRDGLIACKFGISKKHTNDIRNGKARING